MSASTIEWATKSWNPVRGCSRVSPGCDECYAMKFAHRFSGAGKPYEGLTTIRKGKVDWSGVARFIPSELDAPLRWKKPERIFVNSMSDLFHHSLTLEQIAAVFGVMAMLPRHQFLVLTKRPERARDFFNWIELSSESLPDLVGALPEEGQSVEAGACVMYGDNASGYAFSRDLKRTDRVDAFIRGCGQSWPLPNVWLGVSVENQETADERIPLLLKCPAAVRWISAEPLLGPIQVKQWAAGSHQDRNGDPFLRWVVWGSESGPGARPMNIAWGSSLVEQCAAAGVPCFTKQIANARDRKGGDPQFWPAGNWPREYPETA